jgi:hypothetical protein
MEKITLVWNRSQDSSWETDWIEYLFRNIPHDTVENPLHDRYWDRCVIIDTIRWAPYHDGYLKGLQERGYRFALIDLSEETRQDPVHSYDLAEFVLRQHWRGGLADHVLNIPLGYNKGFADITHNPPARQRSYTWAFVGQRWDQTREQMKTAMLTVPNGKIHVASDPSQRLDPVDMSGIYRDSIFVPAPHGWFSVDTFRATEALEAGCIPITDASDYWVKLYGEVPPYPQLNNWAQAPALINHLMANPEALEALRLRCHDWWCETKDLVTSQVEYLVKETLL